MSTTLLSTLFRRAPPPPKYPITFPYTAETNPYQCKRIWPPDFAQLSRKHQFRLERRYRRRTKLKWARPGWKKGTTLAQWAAIGFVVVYGGLYMDFGKGRTVMDDIRGYIRGRAEEAEKGGRAGQSIGRETTVAAAPKG